jgi:hypothetical protein
MENDSEDKSDSDCDSIFEDEHIDINMLEDYNKKMSKYNDFYKENVETIKLKFIYINKDNLLVNIKHDDLILSKPNIIFNGEIIKILKLNNVAMNKKFKMYCMCLYNVSVDSEFIDNITEDNYLIDINQINDVKIEPTINILQDLNELLIVFKEKENNKPNAKSKRISINIKSKYLNRRLTQKKN